MPEHGPASPLRIGDAEKQKCIDQLQEQYVAGRLTHEEFTELSCEAFAARYDKHLEMLTQGFAPMTVIRAAKPVVLPKRYLIPGNAAILIFMGLFWLGVVALILR